MAKSSGPLLIALGAAALLLGGKKKKKTDPSTGGTSTPGDDDNGSGGGGSGSGGWGGSGSGSGSGGSGSSKAQAAGGIWVSPDCKEIAYVNDSPEYWWNTRGKKAAQNFIDADYYDPYEIARALIVKMAPCAAEFPVMDDDLEPMNEEYFREQFLRNFKDVYYLIQWLYNAISELLGSENYTVEFDDGCEMSFMGEDWLSTTGDRMIRFYIDYAEPMGSAEDHNVEAWEGADPDQDFMDWDNNIATALINRMHPTCALEIREGFKRDPGTAEAFFATRPGLKASYDQIVDLVHYIDINRPTSFSFEPMS